MATSEAGGEGVCISLVGNNPDYVKKTAEERVMQAFMKLLRVSEYRRGDPDMTGKRNFVSFAHS